MLKRKENFKCHGMSARPAKNQQVFYGIVNVNFVYSYKKIASQGLHLATSEGGK